MQKPKTVGALRQSEYSPCTVKEELRRNVVGKLRRGEVLFPGIVGFDETVVPQIVNALLSKHDILFLGLRGQAKSRMIRLLPGLLDEFIPVLSGVELLDDPLNPQFTESKRILREHGDDAEIRWVHRDERFNEKLATPDVTIADLIGEIDLIKHAEGRHLNDESIMHFGLVPRSNRCIFAINELPDLPPRIQVGLFNVLEERDVQIRGFAVRLNLDLCMVFSANPEDYTNRGRIVTPLKDRIGSVVRTHYPQRLEQAIEITTGNAMLERGNGDYCVEVPRYMHEIVEETIRLARQSPHINQQSGVSVRASIAATEIMVSNAERRAILLDERRVVPRISDLANMAAGCRGKLELMLADDEKAEDKLLVALVGEAVKNVFANHCDAAPLERIVAAFGDGQATVEAGDEIGSEEFCRVVAGIENLHNTATELCKTNDQDPDDPAHLASAAEFILEALYAGNRLTKYAYHGQTFYKR